MRFDKIIDKLTLFLPLTVWAHEGTELDHHHMMEWAGGFGFVTMFAFCLLGAVLIIILIKWIINQTNPTSQRRSSQRRSALGILERRYARGEIDKNEFEQRKQDLS